MSKVSAQVPSWRRAQPSPVMNRQGYETNTYIPMEVPVVSKIALIFWLHCRLPPHRSENHRDTHGLEWESLKIAGRFLLAFQSIRMAKASDVICTEQFGSKLESKY